MPARDRVLRPYRSTQSPWLMGKEQVTCCAHSSSPPTRLLLPLVIPTFERDRSLSSILLWSWMLRFWDTPVGLIALPKLPTYAERRVFSTFHGVSISYECLFCVRSCLENRLRSATDLPGLGSIRCYMHRPTHATHLTPHPRTSDAISNPAELKARRS